MKYQTGRMGRIIVARFEDGEDLIEGIKDISRKEDIRSGVIYLLGGMREGRLVVGPEEDRMPPLPVWKNLEDTHEVLGMGTIFREGREPSIHVHGAFGRKDSVKVGCLREKASTFLVVETVIIEMQGINAVREVDPVSGMALLKL